MQTYKKTIPLSPLSISYFGLEEWKNSFLSKLDISKNYKKRYLKNLHILKKEFINDSDKYLKFTLICNYSILNMITNYQQYIFFFKKLKKNNIKNIILKKKKIKIKIFDIEKIIFKKYFDNSFLKKLSFNSKLKNFIKIIYSAIFRKKKISCIYINDYTKRLFPKKNFVYLLENLRFGHLKINRNDKLYKKLQKKITKLFFANSSLNTSIQKKNQFLINRISDNFYLTYHFLKKPYKFNYECTFVPNSLSHSLQRAIYLKKIIENKQNESFMHGGAYAQLDTFKTENIFSTAMSIGGNINVSTNYEKKTLNNTYNKNKTFCAFKPIIKVTNRLTEQKNHVKKNNKTILIIGFPMTLDIYFSAPFLNQFSMLKHELKIFDICKKNNLDFEYKIHPERIGELEKLYKSLKIKIIYEKFEDISEKYSTIISPQPASTTFAHILNSNSKLVTFKYKEFKRNSKIKKILRNRAELVTAKLEKNNCINFNEKKFISAINKTKNKNYSKNNYKFLI